LREQESKAIEKEAKSTPKSNNAVKAIHKLAYKEQKELDELPRHIETWEEEKKGIEARFCDADYFSKEPENFQNDQKRLAEIEGLLIQGYARWEALDAKQQSF
ncbi:MAG: ABC transporter, partial [Ghiorsea sp.]|nr:ABC transporter [Ghiorsea sp.]